MFRFPPLTRVVKIWLAVCFAALVVQLIAANFLALDLFHLLALVPRPSLATLWQPITYPLSQPAGSEGLTGFLISGLFFWLMAAPLELEWGSARVTKFLLAVTLGAAAFAFGVGLAVGGQPLYGLGPHLLGVIAAFAWSHRNRGEIRFFGVLPMKSMHMLWFCLGWSVLNFLATRNITALGGDVGAVAVAILYTRAALEGPARKAVEPKKRKSPSHLRVVKDDSDDEPPRWLN